MAKNLLKLILGTGSCILLWFAVIQQITTPYAPSDAVFYVLFGIVLLMFSAQLFADAFQESLTRSLMSFLNGTGGSSRDRDDGRDE